MKLLLALPAASLANAVPDLAPRKFNSIVGMAHSQVTTALSKDDFGEKINKYGCHCFPNGSKAAGGVGPAVDDMDSLCKKLYRCHKCIQIEFGEDAVDVDDGRYTWALQGDNTLSCEKNQNNPARKALCECDRDFAYAMGEIWSDDGFNPFYWLSNRNARHEGKEKNDGSVFDYDQTCQPAANGSGPADACCGASYPNKEPYDSTQRTCCNDVLINVLTQECCGNGSVGSIGSC